jgi:hypothetical protein
MNSLAGIAGRQNPDGMTTAGRALGAALLMADGAVKEGATQDIGEARKALKNPANPGLIRLFHHK